MRVSYLRTPGRGGGRRGVRSGRGPPLPSVAHSALCASSQDRLCFAGPAPAVVSSAGSGDHCVRSFLRCLGQQVFEGAKCRSEDRQCRAKGITRLQCPWYAGILPPYAAPLLGRSLSGSQLSRKRASSLPPLPLLGKPSACLYLAAIPPHLRRGKPRRKCSGRPGGSRSGCRRRQCRNKSATDCAGRSVQGSIRCRERSTSIGQVSRSGSGR